MSFLQRNKNFLIRESDKRNIFLPFLIFIIILIVSLPWTRNIIFGIGTPFWNIRNSITTFFDQNIGVLNSKQELLKENSLLKDELNQNNQELVLYDLLKKENDDLKNILNRNKLNQKLILSTVLLKPYLSPYDTLIIDVGSEDNVKVGDKVLADGNTYIGYIKEVYDNTSKVVLYSSDGEKVNVLIGDSSIEKEAVGIGGGNFKVEVPREIGVSEGDSITIPSISTNIFGVVEKIEYKESDAFQTILFKNPVNISELKYVEILISSKK